MTLYSISVEENIAEIKKIFTNDDLISLGTAYIHREITFKLDNISFPNDETRNKFEAIRNKNISVKLIQDTFSRDELIDIATI